MPHAIRSFVLLAALSLGCAPVPPASEPSPSPDAHGPEPGGLATPEPAASGSLRPPPPGSATPAGSRSPKGTASAASSGSGSPAPGSKGSPLPEVSLLRFERELEVPIRSIGIGRPRVAVLADEPWLKDKAGWKQVPIPPALRPKAEESDRLRIFFGRDDRPRLMGTRRRHDGTKEGFVYLRLMPEGWRQARYEIGQLGNPNVSGGLFGVLGHADPEVVCKVGAQCITKRLTGWKTVPSGPGEPLVRLCGPQAWALYPDGIAWMTDSGWQPLAGTPPWKDPTGFWAVDRRDAWVSVASTNRIHHYDGERWNEQASPVARPRSFWASAKGDVWLVSDEGAAHFDGRGWSRVQGPDGPLSEIEGTDAGDVWVGGQSGLWHGKPQHRIERE